MARKFINDRGQEYLWSEYRCRIAQPFKFMQLREDSKHGQGSKRATSLGHEVDWAEDRDTGDQNTSVEIRL
jgi:hypothetical protein